MILEGVRMEELIHEMFKEFNKLRYPHCSYIYEFILIHSSIKEKNSDITEVEVRKISTIKLQELLQEILEKTNKLKEMDVKSTELDSMIKIAKIGIQIFSKEEYRELYNKMEEEKKLFSLKTKTKIQTKNNTKICRSGKRFVTNEDLIKFLYNVKGDYSKRKTNIDEDVKISPKL